MENKDFVNREKRFEVDEMVGFDAIVSRAGDSESLFHGDLVDFSRTGMKLNLPFCARFNEILLLKLQFEGRPEFEYDGNCRVRHMRNLDDQQWQVGCSTDPPLPLGLIEYLAKSTNQERRQFSRLEVVGGGSVRRQGSAGSSFGQATNMSRGGFCLVVETAHDVGEMIDFVVEGPDGKDRSIAAKICWQEERADSVRIGCSFIESESYDTMIECFDVSMQQNVIADVISWKMVAAAFLALVLPSISCYLFGTVADDSLIQTASVAPVVVVSRDAVVESPQEQLLDEGLSPAPSATSTASANASVAAPKLTEEIPAPATLADNSKQPLVTPKQHSDLPKPPAPPESAAVKAPVVNKAPVVEATPTPSSSDRNTSRRLFSASIKNKKSTDELPKFDRGVRIPDVLKTGVVDQESDAFERSSAPVYVPWEPIEKPTR